MARAQRRIAELERKVGQQQLDMDFFQRALRQVEGSRAAERRAWRDGVYAVIQAMTTSASQGEMGIERTCWLAAGEPGRLLPTLAGFGAAPGRDGVAG